MPVQYVKYGSRGVMVSRRWRVILLEADHDKVGFIVNSGHRTFAQQQALYNQNMISPGVPKPGRPMTAVPSHTAPHIRTGRADHALDVNSVDGGEARLERWVERQGVRIEWNNTVRGEPWHGEVPPDDLRRLEKKIRARRRRRRRQEAKEQRIRRMTRNGVPRRYAKIIDEESRRNKVPLHWALALVQQESDFRNVFGHDQSSKQLTALHGKHVTHERVQMLLRHIKAGGHSNGVGPTQLTSPGYIERAERAGGAHRVRTNIRVGLQVLNEKVGADRDYWRDAWKYNGATSYQAQIEAKADRWRKIMD